MVGSQYGAIGICQFMPTSALRYGLDGDNDGFVNLFKIDDALHSMANYIDLNGLDRHIDIRKALYRYNRSNKYVNTILAVVEPL